VSASTIDPISGFGPSIEEYLNSSYNVITVHSLTRKRSGLSPNERGLGAIEVMACIFLVGLVGITGWLVLRDRPSTPAANSSTMTQPTVSSDTTGYTLATGTYTDASSDDPRYIMQVVDGAGASFNGTMTFQYQDGRQSQVFTFTGTALTPSFSLRTTPAISYSVEATVGDNQLILKNCRDYLPYVDEKLITCTFSLQPS
jgi:hypothetical protein